MTKGSVYAMINFEVGFMSDLGEFIGEKRCTAGLSLKKLGDACGVSDSEIMKIENGTRKNPNWVTLCEIAKVLKFHPFEILLISGYITQQDIHPNAKLSGLERLTDGDLATVQLFVNFVAEQHNKI